MYRGRQSCHSGARSRAAISLQKINLLNRLLVEPLAFQKCVYLTTQHDVHMEQLSHAVVYVQVVAMNISAFAQLGPNLDIRPNSGC